jgi:hypothetical protein
MTSHCNQVNFRDVDVTGVSIKESLLPLPYKEPSQVLFALLGFAVDAGKSFAAIADMKMGEGNEQNPVGTTLALLERGTKVMSAIHKRLHYAQKIEFKLLAKVFQLYLPPEYPYQVVGGNQMIKQRILMIVLILFQFPIQIYFQWHSVLHWHNSNCN